MRLDDLVLRYQQKIGSYDKQRWEKTLEESKILENSFPLRNTKLKTDLIDVDLVRGSTFPKAKPKQSLVQVLYLSILRYFFLPLFSKWWVKETSARVFVVLLSLYFMQMINWAIYSLHVRSVSDDNETSTESNGEEEESSIDLCELIIPMGLSLLLCFTHSQIVATSVFPSRSSNNKRRHKVNFNNNRTNVYDKLKRKKKTFRQRVSNSNNTIDLDKSKGYDSDDEQSVIVHHNKTGLNTLKIPNDEICIDSSSSSILATSQLEPSASLAIRRRRNVNWDLTNNTSNTNSSNNNLSNVHRSTEDDGFESFTAVSSSGEDLRQNQKKESNSDTDTLKNSERSTPIKMSRKDEKIKHSSDSEEDELDDSLTPSSTHFETTDGECMIGVTSNSESDQCDYHSDDDNNVPTKILNPNELSEKVTVTLWTKHFEAKKAEMNAFDISSAIIYRVDSIPETYDYVYIGMAFSVILALTPAYCRLCDLSKEINSTTNNIIDPPKDDHSKLLDFVQLAFGQSFWIKTLLIIAFIQRLVLAFIFFFLLAVAERTFKQRFLYAKLFSHITSTRRARKSLIPHFRLNKVRNIKAWLSVRSYLKRLGPQRSVDLIVSIAFITSLILLAFLSLEFLKDSDHIHSQLNLEALVWSCTLGLYLLRFFTIGAKINKKYRSISVLITEQINLYVQIEKKPQKKEELNVSCSVLKLAENLLKELDSPFKISGLSANSYIYNTVKVVVLSALSGVLSEMLGFKLKLHKIKIK